MSKKLIGKKIAITGAASGIGLECVRALLDEGAKVALVDKDEARLKEICSELGDNAFSIAIDLLDNSSISTMAEKILDSLGGIDIFHANAGSYIGGDILEGDPNSWDEMLNLNINATFKSVRAMLPYMVEQRHGDIIITSSIAGMVPVKCEPIYTSSKHAVQAFTHTIRRQLSGYNIRVGAVLPGPAITPLLKDWPQTRLQKAKDDKALMEAKEVAECVVFMITRPSSVTIRDIVILPSNFDI